jgi:hypothetical protein
MPSPSEIAWEQACNCGFLQIACILLMSTYCARQPKHSYRDEAYATPVSEEEGRLDVESSSHLTCIIIAHMRNSALLVPSVPRRVKDGTNVIYTLYLQHYCIPPVESTAEFQGEFVPSCHRRQRGQPSFSYGFAWLPACLPPSTCDYPYRAQGNDEAPQHSFC